tara:strand:+ start:163 stop:567 length:405 start_codon:yes stop_codon:yes gene_type:complete
MRETYQTTHKRLSSVKSKNTKPELVVRKFLHKKGLRYSLHNIKLPGKPDIVLSKYNAIVFVHGCYWHRHRRCKNSTTPKKNKSFWNQKFKRNTIRDKEVQQKLKMLNWRVFVVWECETSEKSLNQLFKKIINPN